MGVASWRWVLPVFITGQNSALFCSSAFWSRRSAGMSSLSIATAHESWIAAGITSLEDWHRVTWSLGWTALDPRSARMISIGRLTMTSLAFVLVDVPEPVW